MIEHIASIDYVKLTEYQYEHVQSIYHRAGESGRNRSNQGSANTIDGREAQREILHSLLGEGEEARLSM